MEQKQSAVQTQQVYSLFVKPWVNLPWKDLISKVQELGYVCIEYPVRSGCDINPDNCVEKLPRIQKMLKYEGIYISSIAGVPQERLFSAMNDAGITLLRDMPYYKEGENYLDVEQRFIRVMDCNAKLCEKYNTRVGIQPHAGRHIGSNAMELRHLLEQCDSRYIGAVWDMGSSGLAGELATKAIDIVYDYLWQVNLKSAYYKKNVKTDGEIFYKPYYTIGAEGVCNWKEALQYLKLRGYSGSYCMCAEYTDEENVEKYLKEDCDYVEKIYSITEY